MVRSLLSDIELDIHELRFLLNAVTENPDITLRHVAKRNILQMRERLDKLYEELDNLVPASQIADEPVQEAENEFIAEEETTPEEVKEEIVEEVAEQTPEVTIETVIEEVIITSTPSVSEEETISCPEEINPDSLTEEPVAELPKPAEPTPVHESLPAEVILGEQFKRDTTLRKSLSLNDTFLYSRELFGGDTAGLNELLEKLDQLHTAEEALRFASQVVDLTKEDEAAISFIELLKKHFN